MSDERHPWDRREGETPRAYDGFRRYRDAGPLRSLAVVDDIPLATVQRWSSQWDWSARAVAWDDELHQLADRERLEAIRKMHDTHAQAGRVVMAKALSALAQLDIEDIPAYAAARLLELGARLERDTLLTSVEELQGKGTPEDGVDPWEAIARELTGAD